MIEKSMKPCLPHLLHANTCKDLHFISMFLEATGLFFYKTRKKVDTVESFRNFQMSRAWNVK